MTKKTSSTPIEESLARLAELAARWQATTSDSDRRTLQVQTLESRILLNAAPVDAAVVVDPSEVGGFDQGLRADGVASDDSIERLVAEATANAEQAEGEAAALDDRLRTEVVVVDKNVENWQQLVDDLWSDTQEGRELHVVLLSGGRDGVGQIGDALERYDDVDAVHIISHGTSGQVRLGSTTLSNESFASYAGEFARWGRALAADADVMFYGCDLAATADGRDLVSKIGTLCDCDVAASTDVTGHVSLDGDWDLEFVDGQIETQLPVSQQFITGWFGTLDITSNLFAHYEFEENGGGTVTDSSTETNNGALANGPTWNATAAVGDYSLDFTGDSVNNNAIVTVPDDSSLDFGTDMTVAFWYNASVAQDDATRIIGTHDGGDGFSIFANSDGSLQWFLDDGNDTVTVGAAGGLIADGNWHHVAVTRNGTSNAAKIYIDGTLEFDGSVPTINIVNSTAPLTIGGANSFVSDYEGLLDDVRAYDRELSAGDVDELIALGSATTITVNTTSDVLSGDADTSSLAALIATPGLDGAISLREAITAANNQAGTNTIDVNITDPLVDGFHRITLTSALPVIHDTILIDGTRGDDFSGTPNIVIDGNDLVDDGFELAFDADGSTIRGFVIQNFVANGIQINGGSDGHSIRGNWIGSFDAAGDNAGSAFENGGYGIFVGGTGSVIGGVADADRNVISGNFRGIVIEGSGAVSNRVFGNFIGSNVAGTASIGNTDSGVTITSGARNNRIGSDLNGSDDADEGNVIVASGNNGIQLWGVGVEDNLIAGNSIGVAADGTTLLGNATQGIQLGGGASSNTIGGDTAAAANVISGNTFSGIEILGVGTDHNVINGNFIGTDATGTLDLGNGSNGLFILDSAADNTVGGLAGGEGNVIAFNDGDGVAIQSSGSTGNTVRGNSIFLNADQAVDLGNVGIDGASVNDAADADVGGNTILNWPVVKVAAISDSGTLELVLDTTTLDVGSYSVDVYASSNGSLSGTQSSGQTEAERYLGTLTGVGSGSLSLFRSLTGITATPGEFVSVIAVDGSGNSSEISNAAVLTDSDPGGATPSALSVIHAPGGGLSINEDDGNDTYLVSNDGGDILGGLAAVTIEARLTLDGAPTFPHIFDYASDSENSEFSLLLSGDTVRLSIGGASYGFAGSFPELRDGDAHTISVAWDGVAGEASLFIDGDFQETLTNVAQGHTIASGGVITVGNDQEVVRGGFQTNQAVHGTLFDIRLFDSARTAFDIAANHSETLAFDEPNMIADWRFDAVTNEGVVRDAVNGNSLQVMHIAEPGFAASEPVLNASVAEDAANGTHVATVHGVDAEREAVIASLLANDDELVYSAESGKFYRVVSAPVDWATAQSNAAASLLNAVGGQLAVIRDATEFRTVLEAGQTAGVTGVWLGGTDTAVEGEWRWVDGGVDAEQFASSDGSSFNGAFSRFYAGEPNGGVGESHLELDVTAEGWNDITGAAPRSYIVEWDADAVLDATQAVAYSIQSQTVAGAFSIDADSGEIVVADGSLLDYESDAIHTLSVRTTDVDGQTFDVDVVIALEDVVEGVVPTDLSTGVAINTGSGNDVYLQAQAGVSSQLNLTATTLEFVFQVDEPNTANNALLSYSRSFYHNELYVTVESDGKIRFAVHSLGTGELVSTGSYLQLLDGDQHHLAISWDGSTGEVYIYVDGAVAEGPLSYQNGGSISSGGTFQLGQDQDLTGYEADQAFQGTFYDVRIWSDVRNAAEIAANYGHHFDAANIPTGLLANWQFKSLDGGTTVADLVNPGTSDLVVGHVGAVSGFSAGLARDDVRIDENSANGTFVAAVRPTDENGHAGAGYSYSFAPGGDAGGAFAIDGSTGSLTVADSALLDFEAVPSLDVTVRVTESGVGSYDELITITLVDIQEAPVLDNTGTMSFVGVSEDDVNNSGQTVASIIASAGGDRITDDAGDPEGIAIRAQQESGFNGWFEYSLDGGSNWNRMTWYDDSRALLLRATDRIRFVPQGAGQESASLTFCAWDQSSGTAGTVVDVSSNGGTTAFSTSFETATISTTMVNDAPQFGTPIPGLSIYEPVGNAADSEADVVVLADGSTVVVGTEASDIVLTKFAADGTVDVTFGTNGRARAGFPGNDERGLGIAADALGRLVVTGQLHNGTDFDAIVLRFTADGLLDTSFASSGTYTFATAGDDEFSTVALQADGKVVLGGSSATEPLVVRLTADGLLDGSFDSDAFATFDLDSGGSSESVAAIDIQADGKILVAGQFAGPSYESGYVVRLTSTGSLDATFAGTGFVSTTFGLAEDVGGITDVLVQDDGAILIAGRNSTNWHWGLSRFAADGSLDMTFTGDGHWIESFGGDWGNIAGVAQQADGKLIVAGYIDFGHKGQSDWVVTRLNLDGSTDLTYGSNGVAAPFTGYHWNEIYAMAIAPDDSIVVAGYTSHSYSTTVGSFDSSGAFVTSMQSGLLDGTPTFINGGSPVVLDADLYLFDRDLSEATYDGVSVTLSRNGGPDSDDVFSATGSLAALTEGGSLIVDGTTVGSVVSNSGGTLSLLFDASATQGLVNDVIRQIAYANASATPPVEVQIDWVADDGNAGAHGAGGALQATGNTVVSIIGGVTPPSITTAGSETTDEETPIVFSSGNGNAITFSDVPNSQPMTATLVVSNGVLSLGGTGGVSFLNGTSDGSATLTIAGTQSAVNSALDGLTYTPSANYTGAESLTITTGSTSAAAASIYAFYEFEAGGLFDSSGNGRHGSDGAGDPTLAVDAERGDVMSFDGDDTIAVTNGTSGLGDEVTIAAWVDLAAGQDDSVFLSIGDTFYVVLDPANTGLGIGVSANGFTTNTLTPAERIAGDGWHHVAATLNDTTNELNIYLDGVLVKNRVYDFGDIDWPTEPSQDITIGGFETPGSLNQFVGNLDDVRVYDSVLSEADIASVMGDHGSASTAVGIQVFPDGVSHTLPSLQRVDENTSLTFSTGNGNAITVDDGTAATDTRLQVWLGVEGFNGTMTLSQTTGLSFPGGSNGSSSMVIWGTEADINAALEGAVFTPNVGYTGSADVNIETKLAADLQGHYRFENSGDVGRDSSVGVLQTGTGFGNSGPNNGPQVVVDGSRGNVAAFDGVDDYLEIDSDFGGPSSLTMAAWVNAASGYSELFSFDNRVMLRIDDPNSGRGVSAIYHDGAGYHALGSGEFIAGDGWHHVAMTFDGATNEMSLYLDGVLASQDTYASGISHSGGNLVLGSNPVSSTLFLDGLVDDSRVYTRALGGDEIAVLAADGGSQSGTVDVDVVLATSGAGASVPALQTVNEDEPLVFSAGGGNAITVDDGTTGTDTVLDVRLSVQGGNGVLILSQTTGLSFTNGSDGSDDMTVSGTEADINAALEGATFAPNSNYNGPADINVEVALAADPLAFYEFENLADAGEDTADGGAFDAAVQFDADVVTDVERGNVLELDGVQDHLDASSHLAAFAPLAEGTISAWVKLTAAGENTVIDFGDGGMLQNYLSLYVEDGMLSVTVRQDGLLLLDAEANLSIHDGDWHHVAFSASSAGNELYIDGAAVSRTFVVGDASVSAFLADLNSLTSVTIGAYDNGSLTGEFNGRLDDVRIDDRALTASEIAAIAMDGASAVESVSVTVDPVNDPPTVAGGLLASISEGDVDPPGDTISNLVGGTFFDIDAGSSLAGVVITSNNAPVGDGVWQYSTDNGTSWFDVGPTGVNGVTLDSSSFVRFLPTAEFDGAVTVVSFRALDDSYAGGFTVGASRVFTDTSSPGGTSPISNSLESIRHTVVGVNDSPVIATNKGLDVAEGSLNNIITTADLNEGDPDDLGTGLTYTIDVGPVHGTLRRLGLVLAAGDTFTQDDIDANRISYDHDAGEAPTDSFDFTLRDGGEDGAVGASDTFVFTVSSFDDAPTITTIANQSIAEDTSTGPLAFSVNDVDTGGLTVSAYTNNQAIVPNGNLSLIDLGGGNWTIDVAPAADQFGGPVTVTVSVSDASTTTSTTFDLMVAPVNEFPVLSGLDATPTFAEGGGAVVLDANVVASDPDLDVIGHYGGANLVLHRNPAANGDDVFSATGSLGALNEGGPLVLSGTTIGSVNRNSGGRLEITFSSSASQADVTATLRSIAYANTSVAPPSSVTLRWQFGDGNAGAQGPGGPSNFITVQNVSITDSNSVPTATPIANQFIVEDSSTGPLSFTVADMETAASSLSVTAASDDQTLVPDGNLTLVDLGGGNWTIDVQPSAHQNGGPVTITIDVSDGLATTQLTFEVSVAPVNDAPFVTSGPGGGTYFEGGAGTYFNNGLTIADIDSVDFDSGSIVVAIDANVEAGDRLMIRNGQGVSVLGNDIVYGLGGPVVGSFTGGVGATPLTIAFNASSTLASVQAVAQQIAFLSVSEDPSAVQRTLSMVVTDGDGGTANPVTRVMNVNSVNDAPTVTAISNQTVAEDVATGPLAFSIGDLETAVGSLAVTATSSDQTLIPDGNLSLVNFGGGDWTVDVRPATNLTGGPVTITIAVDDGDITSFSTFDVTVVSVDDAPAITAIGDQVTLEDAPTGPLSFSVSDVETAADVLIVTAASDDQARIPDGNLSLVNLGGGDWTIDVAPAANQLGGPVGITLAVSDGTTTTSTTFDVTILGSNDVPTISPIADQAIVEDSSTGPLAFVVNDIETAAGALIVTATSNDQTLVPDANIVLGGAGANRTISVTPVANQNGGPATITVSVFDGIVTTQTTFDVTVAAVNDAPTISAIGDQVVLEDRSTGPLGITVTDIETAAGALTLVASSDNPALIPDGSVSLVDLGNGNWTIEAVPVGNTNGSATITVSVFDGTSTVQTAFDVTVVATNDAPVISGIGDVVIPEDGSTGSVAFAVSDVETSASALVVNATSSDIFLVPNANISLVDLGGGNWTVEATPAANRNGGPTTITLAVTDGLTTTTTAFRVTVDPVNDAPSSINLAGSTVEENAIGGTVVGSLSVVDIDANDTHQFVLDNDAGGRFAVDSTTGVLEVTNVGGLNYEAAASHEVTVRATDASGATHTATFTIAVTDLNESPVGQDSAFETTQVGEIRVDAPGLAAMASDDDGDLLTAVLVSDVAAGQLVFNNDGSFTYTPSTNFEGVDTFSYRVSDGVNVSAPITVSIDVAAVAPAPPNTRPDPVNLETNTPDPNTPDTDAADDDFQEENVDDDNTQDETELEESGAEDASSEVQNLADDASIAPTPVDTQSAVGPNVLSAESAVADGSFAVATLDRMANAPSSESAVEFERQQRAIAREEAERRSAREAQESRTLRTSFVENAVSDIPLSINVDELAGDAGPEEEPQLINDELIIGTTKVVSTSLTVGYVVWMVRGGTLVASLVASLPAWTTFDPLAILAAVDSNEGLTDGESLTDLVSGDEQPENNEPLENDALNDDAPQDDQLSDA